MDPNKTSNDSVTTLNSADLLCMMRRHPIFSLFPYTTLLRPHRATRDVLSVPPGIRCLADFTDDLGKLCCDPSSFAFRFFFFFFNIPPPPNFSPFPHPPPFRV